MARGGFLAALRENLTSPSSCNCGPCTLEGRPSPGRLSRSFGKAQPCGPQRWCAIFLQVARSSGLCFDLDVWAQRRDELLVFQGCLEFWNPLRLTITLLCFGQQSFDMPTANFDFAAAERFEHRFFGSAISISVVSSQLSDGPASSFSPRFFEEVGDEPDCETRRWRPNFGALICLEPNFSCPGMVCYYVIWFHDKALETFARLLGCTLQHFSDLASYLTLHSTASL